MDFYVNWLKNEIISREKGVIKNSLNSFSLKKDLGKSLKNHYRPSRSINQNQVEMLMAQLKNINRVFLDESNFNRTINEGDLFEYNSLLQNFSAKKLLEQYEEEHSLLRECIFEKLSSIQAKKILKA